MTIDIQVLTRSLVPEKTVLIFGSGSSVPSGAPTGVELSKQIAQKFDISDAEDLSLSDLSTIAEIKTDRYSLVTFIREKIKGLKPSGGLLNLPLYSWSGIYTTNYDDLIEKSYHRKSVGLSVYSSNYDFHGRGVQEIQRIYKLHGTIDKDECDGHKSRMIITASDYDITEQYRELIYSRLQDDLNRNNVLIIGQSLADPDLRAVVEHAQHLKSNSGAPGGIYLFIYEKNESLALIHERRGLHVCFGGIDEFFDALTKNGPAAQLALRVGTEIFDVTPDLAPSTISVSTARVNETGQLEKMYNGKAASYADIARSWVFERDICSRLESQLASPDEPWIAYILGSAGVGKTTAVRVTLSRLVDRDIECWEHRSDFELSIDGWAKVASELHKRKVLGVLFVDNAHNHLHEVNKLIETISAQKLYALRIVLVSSKPHWNPRLKTPALFLHSHEYVMNTLSSFELNRLLDLLEESEEIKELVDDTFLGFNRPQRLERLRERCSADMFVCMKNIFGFQAIDTILLEEFSSLDEGYRQIYKLVAGMEAVGVRVHREMVRRTTGLQANNVSRTIDDLDGIIEEYVVSERMGIYGWKVRHSVIANTIAKYKYSSQDDIYELFDMITDKINPTYQLEVRSIADMCDLQTGISRITDRSRQNVLLRKMMSLAPDERVPRHRLIFNLIELHKYDDAEREIRIFEKQLGLDGPVHRYKIKHKISFARNVGGLETEDRAAVIQDAASMAQWGIQRFNEDKNMYKAYLEAGVAYYKYSKDLSIFESAMQAAQEALEHLMDPQLRRIVSQYSRISHDMGIAVGL